jgi:hypothetical protein
MPCIKSDFNLIIPLCLCVSHLETSDVRKKVSNIDKTLLTTTKPHIRISNGSHEREKVYLTVYKRKKVEALQEGWMDRECEIQCMTWSDLTKALILPA